MAHKIKVKEIRHVGIVVKDADAVAAQYEKYFDIDWSKKRVTDTTTREHGPFLYKGERVEFNMKIVIFPLGGIEIELIEPLDDKGPYADFLRETGGGLHHFMIEVDGNENFIEVANEIGAPNIIGGYMPGISWKYFDMKKDFASLYEITQKERFEGV